MLRNIVIIGVFTGVFEKSYGNKDRKENFGIVMFLLSIFIE